MKCPPPWLNLETHYQKTWALLLLDSGARCRSLIVLEERLSDSRWSAGLPQEKQEVLSILQEIGLFVQGR